MEENGLTLYKLMILFLIKKVDFPLSNSQISEFILDKGYTTYFKLQQAFHELEDEDMLRTELVRNASHYFLTEEGKEAIDMFEYQLSEPIRNDILTFLATKEYQLREETNLEADYFPANRTGLFYIPLILNMIFLFRKKHFFNKVPYFISSLF